MAESLVIKINGNVKDFTSKLDEVKKQTEDLSGALSSVASGAKKAFLGLTAAVGGTAFAFSRYEKALIGVGKTTDISGDELNDFGKRIQSLSKEIPVATNELLKVSEIAGQLGVTGSDNLVNFTETIAKLTATTNLGSEEAATSLTRILNVTGESIDNIDELGSVIVELGNNFAANEREIVRMANELSRATAVFGVSSTQAAALSTALTAVGVRAELGGSVVGKAFREIDNAITEGGESMKRLSELTGITVDNLQKKFEKDSVGVFQSFVMGLQKIEQQGGSVAKTLEEFGLSGDEVNKVLPVLAKNSSIVGDALDSMNKELKNTNALNNEAEKAFDSVDAKFIKFKNTALNAAVNIGEKLAPSIVSLLEKGTELADMFVKLDDNALDNIATFLKWGTGISALVAGVSTLGIGAIALSAKIAALDAVFLGGAVAASTFWTAVTGPIGLAVAGLAAVTAGAIALARSFENDTQTAKDLGDEIEKLEEQKRSIEAKKEKGLILSATDVVRLQDANNEIDKLIEKKNKLNAQDADFGTGSVLFRPEADTKGLDLSAGAFGVDQDQAIPFRINDEEKEKAVESVAETRQRIREKNAEQNELDLEQDRVYKEAILAIETEEKLKRAELDKQLLEAQKKNRKELNAFEKLSAQERIGFFQDTFGALSSLQSAFGKENKEFRVAQAIASSFAAVNKVLAEGPPFPANVAAAAAIGAQGLANVARIRGTNFAKGGVFQGGISGVDSIPAMVQRNEIIAPTKSFDEVVEGTARQRGFTRDGDSTNTVRVVLEPTGELSEFIERKIVESRFNNTGLI